MSVKAFNLTQLDEKCCIVVGLGLVGGAIARGLGLLGKSIRAPGGVFSWENANEVFSAINLLAVMSGRKDIEVIWCAGRAGFESQNSNLASEYRIFSVVMKRLIEEYGDRLSVSLLSSAGGVYEGQELVSNIDSVSPMRPYGKWKVKQEELLRSLTPSTRIFRISSAYGYLSDGSRVGLIGKLISSTRVDSVTLIYASPHTLRDYIFTEDITRFVLRCIVEVEQNGTFVLATGRSTSIQMLSGMVERILNRPLKITYSSNNENSKDICFSKKSLPADLEITPLEESIPLIAARF